jgi:hypothetical protein
VVGSAAELPLASGRTKEYSLLGISNFVLSSFFAMKLESLNLNREKGGGVLFVQAR